MSKYTEDLKDKYIKKSGRLPPYIMGLSEEKNQEVQMVLMEQWIEGYKTAKKKFKEKYKG